MGGVYLKSYFKGILIEVLTVFAYRSLNIFFITLYTERCIHMHTKYACSHTLVDLVCDPISLSWAGCSTKSILKWSTVDLNSVFLLLTGCYPKPSEHSQPYYFTHSWRKKRWIHMFPGIIYTKWNASNLSQDLNSVLQFHFQEDDCYSNTPPYKTTLYLV